MKAVSGIQLSDHLVDTVFTIFDENGKFFTRILLAVHFVMDVLRNGCIHSCSINFSL